MEIIQVNDKQKGFFKAIEKSIEAGIMSYTWAGESKFIIDHTEVNPSFKGQNVGKQLVLKAVEFAREHQFKILPLCPFAKSVFDKDHSIHDVLFV